MIEVAVILSGIVRHWPDFFIILLLLFANATIGFWEERQAGNAIEALKAKLAIKAWVKRDGKWVTPPAKDLVPGDVIRLRLGDIVPADARLLDGDEISVDQSALTGESLPAAKRSGEAVFSGSIIRRGEVGALVYATGGKTYFGKTAQLVETAHTTSHFQKAVLKIGNYLIVLAVALVAVIIGVGIYRRDPILTTLQFALVLTVAAIPVAMPTVLSVTMTVGARLLAKKEAIISRLIAIEELAGVDILCADKTGTLTQNKLTLGDPFCVGDVSAADVIFAAALASRADNDDTIDLAVLAGVTLQRYIDTMSITGLTSNPTIFDHAISRSNSYDAEIHSQLDAGRSGEALFFNLAIQDLTRAADLFGPTYARTATVDGLVSLEVSPLLAYDTDATVKQAKALHAQADRPNLYIKIPGVTEGLPAIEEAIFAGVPVSVTLLFSADQYKAAADAYLTGLERRVAAGLSADIRSVASLSSAGGTARSRTECLPLCVTRSASRSAVRPTRRIGTCWKATGSSRLENLGARPQRLLFASTGTKDKSPPDTLYIAGLAAANTVNTMPEETLLAFADHGNVPVPLPLDGGDSEASLAAHSRVGIDRTALAAQLQSEGAKGFVDSSHELLGAIAAKSKALA